VRRGNRPPFKSKIMKVNIIHNMHTPKDKISNMNLDYWMEQIKATTVTAAHLAIPTEK